MSQALKFYTEPSFLQPSHEDVFHGFFTRLGGVSDAPYRGLNCGAGSGDAPENVMQNRSLVAQEVGVEPQSLLSVYQVHGSKTIMVHEPWLERPKSDSFVTDKAGIALGILTADCAPVLFCGEKEGRAPVIGAAHAGWKGALSGVLGSTVDAMEDLGALRDSIRACVGPCIGKPSYEVSHDFIEPFLDENEESERFFHSASREGHALFDLSGYCAWRLSRAGLKNVSITDQDTYSNEAEFYSYRRMTHQGEVDYGRQISVIAIKS